MIDLNLFTLPTNYNYRQELLTPLLNLLDYYIDNHSKVMVVRVDLHYPQDYPIVKSNSHISNTIAYMHKKYARQGLDPKYFWKMEQLTSNHQHYHIVLFLDAQKVRSYSHVFQNIQEAWGRALQVDASGCVYHCNTYHGQVDMNRNGLQVRRCDGEEKVFEQTQAIINQISYLAKDETTAEDNDGLRNFGMSRLPKKEK